ncbi:MAG TPA: M48 family metalloprotease [Acidimicrobiales bacterium]
MNTASTRPEHDALATGRREGRSAVASLAARLAVAAVIPGVVLGVVVLAVAGAIVGLIVAVAVWALVAGALWFGLVAPRIGSAEERVLHLVGPHRRADPRRDARYLNLVEGLAPGAGLPRPDCVVIDDPSVNALAVGRDARHGVLVATSGLLERMSRMELEGVIARGLAQLRDGTTAGPTVALALGRVVTAGEWEALAADAQAVSLTRYPPGLSAALRTLLTARHDGAPDVPRSTSSTLASLWLAPPGGAGALERRAEALEAL